MSHAGGLQPDPPAARLPRPALSQAGATLLAFALALGFWLRVAEIGPAFLFGDELHSLADMSHGFVQLLQTFSDTGSGMLLPLLQAALVDVFGATHWALRAPAWIAGLALLFLTWPIARKRLGDGLAIGVTALVALSPILVFYTRFARIYALCALLCLLLLARIEALLDPDRAPPTRRDWLVLLGLTALLPYAHPTTLGFILPLYAAAIGVAAANAAQRPLALRLMATLAGAGLLCVLAHAPAWASLHAFVNDKTTTPYLGAFGVSDVAALVFGGRALGQAALGLGCVAAAALLRARGPRALPLIAAAFGPALVIALVAPYGDAYAYARYVLPGLVPFFLLLGSAANDALAHRVPASAGRAQLAVASAITLVALLVALPMVVETATRAHGQHANTYLPMRPLAPFDAPWPGASAFYAQLAREVEARPGITIVEAPALTTRTRHLYRTHQRSHGAHTVLAPLHREFPRIPSGPYVSLTSPAWATASDADYLVVHLDVAREVQRYWDFVYGNPPRVEGPERAYMERHLRYGGLLPPAPPGLIERMSARYGEPVFRDADIVAWALRKDVD